MRAQWPVPASPKRIDIAMRAAVSGDSRHAIALPCVRREFDTVPGPRRYENVPILDFQAVLQQVVHEWVILDVRRARQGRRQMHVELGHEVWREREAEGLRDATDLHRLADATDHADIRLHDVDRLTG